MCATLGQTKKGEKSNGGKLLDAMFSVDGESEKYPEFEGNVAAVARIHFQRVVAQVDIMVGTQKHI